MSSFARSCYPMAVQAVREAIAKDTSGETKEAYCCYLSSILFMIQALKDEAWEQSSIDQLCHGEAFKLFKLTEQSLGRAHDILKNAAATVQSGQQKGAHAKLSATTSVPVSTKCHSLPTSPRRQVSEHPSPKSMKNLLSALPTPPGMINLPTLPEATGRSATLPLPGSSDQLIRTLPTPPGLPTSSPGRSYQAHNSNVFAGYQSRKSKDTIANKYNSCTNNMSMFREMAEREKLNARKEKEHQEKMLIRRQQIKEECERRWNQINTRSSKDKEYRQKLLETILSYEQDATWPVREMRDTLVVSSEDTGVIVKIVRTILTYDDHPLCKVLKEIQYEIWSKIEAFVKVEEKESESLSDQDYLKPVDTIGSAPTEVVYDAVFNEASQSEQADTEMEVAAPKDTELKDLEDDMFSSDSDDNDDVEAENKQPQKATDQEGQYDKLSSVRSQTETMNPAQASTGESENVYDVLNWNTKPPSTAVEQDDLYEDPSSHHPSSPPQPQSNYEALGNIHDNIYEDVNDVLDKMRGNAATPPAEAPQELSSEVLKTVDSVVQDILFGIDRLHSVIILTYETLNTPVGQDLSYSHLESIFFKPLWPWLIRLFQKLNVDKEKALADVMESYMNSGPSELGIRDKLTLNWEQNGDAYREAIEEMKQVVQYSSPLDKLECIVRASKSICQCVENHYNEKGEKSPSIGCDDLLPLTSYVVLKSGVVEIISECHAITEFIHDGYLMGEEGYCLTTLHAAISNLLSLASYY